MHCHACDTSLPTDPSTLLDEKTGRYYCPCCEAVITDLIEEMKGPPIDPETGELLVGDELPIEETYPCFNSPLVNYDK